jgi:hypothetical protein
VSGDKALTARHVVGSRRSVTFKMAVGDYEANVLFSYREIDLALLQLKPSAGQSLPALPPVELSSAKLPVQFVAWGYGVPADDAPRLVLGDGTVRAYAAPLYQLQYTNDVLLHGMSGGPVAIEEQADGDAGRTQIRVFAIIEGAYTSRSPDPQFKIGFATAVDAFPSDLLNALGSSITEEELRFEQGQRKRISAYTNGALAALGVAGVASVGALTGLLALTPAMVAVAISLSGAGALHLVSREAKRTLTQTRSQLRTPPA